MRKLHANHEQCWEMIPWIVNGRASDAERQAVLAHAEECAECQAELAQHRELHGHMRGSDDIIAAPNASWQKLLAQIDERAGAEIAKARTYRLKRPWLVAAVWVQLIAIAALTGALFTSGTFRRAEYTTLSTPQVLDRRAAVRIVFSPSVSVNDINQLLRDVKCDIISGPSEAGVYTLAANEGANVSAIIATLREHPGVLFAEPSPMAAGRTR